MADNAHLTVVRLKLLERADGLAEDILVQCSETFIEEQRLNGHLYRSEVRQPQCKGKGDQEGLSTREGIYGVDQAELSEIVDRKSVV